MTGRFTDRLEGILKIIRETEYIYNDDLGALTIEYASKEQRTELINLVSDLAFEEELSNSSMTLYTHQPSIKTVFYVSKDDFESRLDRSNFLNTIIIIGKSTESTLVWGGDCDSAGDDSDSVTSNFYFKNILAYFSLLDFLKSLDDDKEHTFHFVDHFNEVSKQIIFTSPKKEGKLIIPFRNFIPKYSENEPFKKIVDQFIDSFSQENKHLPKFIKAELFEVLPKVERNKRMQTFVDSLSTILSSSFQNFEIYLSDLSLDSLRKEYMSTRDKFFQQYRDVLSKITNQIIGFPVALSATAFATYKAVDSQEWLSTVLVLSLIFIAFLLFAFFNTFVLKIHKHDIADLSVSFGTEYDEIVASNFFIKFPTERGKFETIKQQIDRKLGSLREIVAIYFWSTLIVNSLFCLFIFSQIFLAIKIIYLVFLFIILIAFACYFWFS